MSEDHKKDSLSRRSALKVLAGTAGAVAAFPILKNRALGAVAHPHAHPARAAAGAAAASTPFKPQFFTDVENKMVTTLSELIIPEDEKSPGAKAARVNEFIDLMVNESDKEEQELWREGLRRLDQNSQDQFSKKFLESSTEQQVSLLEQISRNEGNPHSLEDSFFERIKRRTIEGYYTSEIGIHQELEYKGNTVLLEFEGCTHPEHGA